MDLGLCITPATPMSPTDTLAEKFRSIFAYSEQYPERQQIVECFAERLTVINTLLNKVDAGQPLSVLEKAALLGLLEQVARNLRAQNDGTAREMGKNLLVFEITLGEISVEACNDCDSSWLYDPNFKECVRKRCCTPCSSPDICP
jgi:hypothetical protein